MTTSVTVEQEKYISAIISCTPPGNQELSTFPNLYQAGPFDRRPLSSSPSLLSRTLKKGTLKQTSPKPLFLGTLLRLGNGLSRFSRADS